jgi:hypothetical protein
MTIAGEELFAGPLYVIRVNEMGDRNFLHVCRHCGNVMASSSPTGPRACVYCESANFSRYLGSPERPET